MKPLFVASAVALLLFACAAPALAQDETEWEAEGESWDPEGETLIELGFLGVQYEDTRDAETMLGGSLAWGMRYDNFTYQPTVQAGQFINGDVRDPVVLVLYPLSFIFEFGELEPDEDVGLTFYFQAMAGFEMFFFQSTETTQDNTEVLFNLPVEGALGARLYLGDLYIFVSFLGGYHIFLDATDTVTGDDDLWRWGGNAGVGFVF